MLCRYYVIESTASHGIWIVAAQNNETAIVCLPVECGPYQIIWNTEAVKCETPLVARLHLHLSGDSAA